MTVWTSEQARRFLDSLTDDRLRGLWALALHTGMRRGELAGLRWSDVDLEAATLTIAQQRTTTGRQTVTTTPKARSQRQLLRRCCRSGSDRVSCAWSCGASAVEDHRPVNIGCASNFGGARRLTARSKFKRVGITCPRSPSFTSSLRRQARSASWDDRPLAHVTVERQRFLRWRENIFGWVGCACNPCSGRSIVLRQRSTPERPYDDRNAKCTDAKSIRGRGDRALLVAGRECRQAQGQ